jgi:hypothetical protein
MHARGSDLDESAFPLVGAGNRRVRRGQASVDVDVRAPLCPEQREGSVPERKFGIVANRLNQQGLSAGLDAQDPVQRGEVTRGGAGGRTDRQPVRVARAAPDARGRQRGEDFSCDLCSLHSDLRDRGALPQLPAPQRADDPRSGLRARSRQHAPGSVGFEAEVMRARLREPGREQVQHERVMAGPHAGGRPSAVQHGGRREDAAVAQHHADVALDQLGRINGRGVHDE